MKITVMNAEGEDIWRVPGLIAVYRRGGFADGNRPHQKDCVIYAGEGRDRAAAVWGGPDHIRIAFPKEPLP
jgi:hypothetical protein